MAAIFLKDLEVFKIIGVFCLLFLFQRFTSIQSYYEANPKVIFSSLCDSLQ